MKPAIVVERISKKYSRKPDIHASYGIRDLWREIIGTSSDVELRADEFLAVNNISFHVNAGDTIALIGRNGSGKTTLLKMICGLIKPDDGLIVTDGRVQALINLGAGFNPNLSGRENVFNSSALIGIGRKEAQEIMEGIIEFSELEEFIDSPVGTYSSGMKSRLGFAVASHLKPDILLIDEILSTGDFAFRNKCYRRMQELKRSGVTIILVSHSHNTVIQFCDKAIWLDKGKEILAGPSKDVVTAYLAFLEEKEALRQKKIPVAQTKVDEPVNNKNKTTDPFDGIFGPVYDEFDKIDNLETLFCVNGTESETVNIHDGISIKYKFNLKVNVSNLNITLKFFRRDGLNLTTLSTLNRDLLKSIHHGLVSCEVKINDFYFNPGQYILAIAIHEGKSYLYRNIIKEFFVKSPDKITWGLTDFDYEYIVHSS